MPVDVEEVMARARRILADVHDWSDLPEVVNRLSQSDRAALLLALASVVDMPSTSETERAVRVLLTADPRDN